MIRSQIRHVASILVVATLVIGLFGSFFPVQNAMAGDGRYKISGFVWSCASDPGRLVFSDTRPDDCVGENLSFTVTTKADDFASANTAAPDATGFYQIEDGTSTTVSLLLGISQAPGLTGALSCYFMSGPDQTDVGDFIIPLGPDGSAEILAGQPAWDSAFCIFSLFPVSDGGAGIAGTSNLIGNVFQCDTDLRTDSADAIDPESLRRSQNSRPYRADRSPGDASGVGCR